MRNTILPVILILFVGLFVLSAFQNKVTISRVNLIKMEVNKRIEAYSDARMKRCENKVMRRATEMVDSILIDRARSMTIDTFQKPPIPTRPDRPIVPIVEDTTAIAPLITDLTDLDSLQLDSLSSDTLR